MIVLLGNNGVGKTNILEAISLLVPGRGMRMAKHIELGYCPPCPRTRKRHGLGH